MPVKATKKGAAGSAICRSCAAPLGLFLVLTLFRFGSQLSLGFFHLGFFFFLGFLGSLYALQFPFFFSQALFFFFRSHPRQAFVLQLLVRLGRRFNNGNVHTGGNQQQKQCHKVTPTDGTAGCQCRVAAKAECAQIRAPLTANGAFLSSAMQAARVKIDEEGVEAAAYTEIVCADSAMMEVPHTVEMDLDRPFLFVIFDNSNVPLFVGTVNTMA